MRCQQCNSELKINNKEVLHSISDIRVTILNLTVYECKKCDHLTYSIPAPKQLNFLIAFQLVSNYDSLLPEHIKFLRKFMKINSKDFALKMKVTPQTVTGWESGNQKMSGHYQELLKEFTRQFMVNEIQNFDGIFYKNIKDQLSEIMNFQTNKIELIFSLLEKHTSVELKEIIFDCESNTYKIKQAISA